MKNGIVETTSIVVPLAIIASMAVVCWFTQGVEDFSPRSSEASPLLTVATPGKDRVGEGLKTQRSIQEVKEDWEEKLMAMPGVMGVGISLTKDRREPCIQVYVNRALSEQELQIPEQIEGYPVEVEVRGAFQPLKYKSFQLMLIPGNDSLP